MIRRILLVSFVTILIGCSSSNHTIDPSTIYGNVWVLESLSGKEVGSYNFSNGIPFMEFKSDGSLNGFDGCNRTNGNYKLVGNELSFGPMMSTRMACEEIDSYEFEKAMSLVTSIKTEKGELKLLDEASNEIIVFTKK